MREVSKKIKDLDSQVREIQDSLHAELLAIPNIPDESVPEGKSEEDNVDVRKWGDIRKFEFNPESHQELGEKLEIIDFERGTKLTGSGFVIFKGAGAKLERALINFMLELHTNEHEYIEISPPFIVNSESLITTGNLPKFEDDLYSIENDDFYLIPTAEVPVTNIHRKEILEEKDLPIKYVSYTPCFRREAGSWGQDTKGLIRQHQFDKVELVKFTRPEDSEQELESLVNDAEKVLKLREVRHKIVKLSTGDMGFA